MSRRNQKAIRMCLVVVCAFFSERGAHGGQETVPREREVKLVIRGEAVESPLPAFHRAFMARHGYLGVRLLRLTPELRAHFGVPKDAGVMVAQIVAGSPAEAAGIRVGDIITTVDGERVESPFVLSRHILAKEAGDGLTLEIWRDGSPQSIWVTVEQKDRQVMDFGAPFKVLRAPGDETILWRSEDGTLVIDDEIGEAVKEAVERVKEQLRNGELREHLERLENMDWTSFRKKMEEVESRLESLEKELEEMEEQADKPSREPR